MSQKNGYRKKVYRGNVYRRKVNGGKVNGGKVIGSGGFGCIFTPELKCTNKSVKYGKSISKLMKKKYATIEYNDIIKYKTILSAIPDYENYFLIKGFSLCTPEKLEKSDLINFDKKCSALKKMDITSKTVNNSLDKLTAINMPYGGVDVGKYIVENKMDYKILYKLNESLIELLKNGIIPMNEKGVYHCDVKDSNILVDSFDKTRLIDWGLSTIHKSGDAIPKILLNRPFQFNTPFSAILFNSVFEKMYAKFLKTNSEPSYLQIRAFVINYVMAWIGKRGNGHFSTINNIFTVFFSRELINIEKQFKDQLIEFEYTFYYIFEYISIILFKFTKNGKFLIYDYFDVFLKNIDIWGFVMAYLPILDYLNKHFSKLSKNEIDIFDKIKEMILFINEKSDEPINMNIIFEKLKDLSTLFLKSEKSSTVVFKFSKTSSSKTKKNKTKTKKNKSKK